MEVWATVTAPCPMTGPWLQEGISLRSSSQPPNTWPTTATSPGLSLSVHALPLSTWTHYKEQMEILTFQYSNNWLKRSVRQNVFVIHCPKVPLGLTLLPSHHQWSIFLLNFSCVAWKGKWCQGKAMDQVTVSDNRQVQIKHVPGRRPAHLGGDSGTRGSESSTLYHASVSEGLTSLVQPQLAQGPDTNSIPGMAKQAETTCCCLDSTWRTAGIYLGILGTSI